MSEVIKVSKPTYPADTTDNQNLSFSSELATHSIFVVTTMVKTSPATSVTYTHNLGFAPKAWVFEILNDGEEYYRRIPVTISSQRIDFYTTTTTLVIQTDETATKSFRAIIFTRSPNP